MRTLLFTRRLPPTSCVDVSPLLQSGRGWDSLLQAYEGRVVKAARRSHDHSLTALPLTPHFRLELRDVG